MDEGSFEDFYVAEYRQVLAFARVLTGSREHAEDVAQEAFAAALESWNGLENPAGWVRSVVANKVRSRWRRVDAERRAVERLGSTPLVGDELGVEAEEFWRLVRSLPKRQAQTVALFYLEDRPVSEIASILGCGESTARVHLMRGRRRLARLLGVDE